MLWFFNLIESLKGIIEPECKYGRYQPANRLQCLSLTIKRRLLEMMVVSLLRKSGAKIGRSSTIPKIIIKYLDIKKYYLF